MSLKYLLILVLILSAGPEGRRYPHNAILFYDKIKIGLLKAFFSGCGILTGTAVIPILPHSFSDPGLNTTR